MVQEFRQLHQHKFRESTGLFIAEGEKVVGDLIDSGLEIQLVAGTADYLALMKAKLQSVEQVECSTVELTRLSLLKTPNKIIAIARQPAWPSLQFSDPKGMYLVLDGIRDPGNMGTLIRTAEWFGVQAVICSPDCVGHWNPKVVQGAMGSLFRLPVYDMPLETLLDEAKKAGIKSILGAVMDGEPINNLRLPEYPVLMIIGAEATGLSAQARQALTHAVTIPLYASAEGGPDSLNAAVAGGIIMHQVSQMQKGRQ